MCGIAGFCFGKSNAYEQIHRMTDTIKHRGPDSDGFWMAEDNEVVLGHRRLAILDCSPRGAQPMISQSGRYVVSYNGEIYNHLDLRTSLEKKGIDFKSTSDTETLVEAFDLLGVSETLDTIKGMYAIALYDRQDKIIYLIRDRVGEKPLYYGHINGQFIFASDLACFKAIDNNDLEIDTGAVELFFRRGYIPAPYSIYKDIRKLEPGHFIQIRYPYLDFEDKVYWSAHDISAKCHENPFKGSIEEATDELERLLKQALKGQMLSDVPLGAFLSAGIDSSTIVSLMQEISDEPIRTYTIGVDVENYDEAPIAKKIASALGTNHTEEYVSVSELKAVIPTLSAMYTEPFADSSQVPTSVISRIARKNVTVVLSGDGGDELFCGYGRYNGWVLDEWNKQRRFPYAIQCARAKALEFVGRKRSSKCRRLKSQSLAETYSSVVGGDSSLVKSDLLYEDTFDSFDYDPFFTDQDVLMQMDFQEYLPDDILTKVDRAAMFHSLETRIPFLDKDVVEFAWSLPLDMKFSGGVTKKILRDILYKKVDKGILERPKTGFSIPLESWLRTGDLMEWANSILNYSTIKDQGIIDASQSRKIWDEYLKKNIWSDTLWRLIVFQSWMCNNSHK